MTGAAAETASPVARARALHLVVALVAVLAVLWQLVLVVQGAAVLDETNVPPLATRVVRFFCYFTVLSNLLVLVTSVLLARDPGRDGPVWRVVRAASLVGIAVTGLVHWFLLRPILDLTGPSWAVDKLLHVVVPVLALAAWLAAGPRGRLGPGDVLRALVWPVVWAAWTLVHGLATHWWPYPFIDVDRLGWGPVLVAVAGVGVLYAVVGLVLVAVDRALQRRAPATG